MAKRATLVATFFLLAALVSAALALEKVEYGTAVRAQPIYFLPILAAEEKGFWRENGLQVTWVPFRNTASLYHSISGGHIVVGIDNAIPMIPAIARGVPGVFVSNWQNGMPAVLWVLSKSPIKDAKELKGARVGVVSLGGTAWALAKLLVRSLDIERDVRFVAAGGLAENMAALKAGAITAASGLKFIWMPLLDKGEVRELANLDDYARGQWVAHVVFARKDFLKSNPEIIARVVKAGLQSLQFLVKDRRWAVDKLKKEQGLSEKGAQESYDSMKWMPDGKIDPGALETVRNFLIEFGLVPKDKAPRLEELYTKQFTG